MEGGKPEEKGLRTPGHLLAAHSSDLYPGIYFIRRLANFRAQMRRAVKLVRAAVHEKVFQKRSTLLVVGGGISGLAAGLEAAKHGMIVTLIESDRKLLSVQRKCATRYMHPYEYDWPLAHYRKNSFPFLQKDKRVCPEQMSWQAGMASSIATKMEKRILSRSPSNLNFALGFQHIPVSLKTLREDFDPIGEFDFIFICAGAKERTRMKEFASFRYWESDPLEKLSMGRYRHSVRKVLLSGGGDGGLQDFLRIVHYSTESRPFSAGLLLKKLLPALNRSPEFVEWVRKKQGNCRSFRPDPETMWRELQSLLDSIEKNADCWNSVSRELRANLDPNWVAGERHIQLAFKGELFSEAFTLNAFLVHLTDRVVKRGGWLRPRCELDEIVSATKSHRCAGRPKNCCGKPHRVTFDIDGRKLRKAEEFDLIVLRHGSIPSVPDIQADGG